MNNTIQQMAKIIQNSKKLVFFGGAGVSTESGIPDFRSATGIYQKDTGTHYSPEQIISASFFRAYPEIFFKFHFEHLVYPEAEPNEAHKLLADIEAGGKDVTVVTQNIDRLHQKAGSQRVIELHGAVDENYCVDCQAFYTYSDLSLDEKGIPRCTKCHGIVRPDIVLYEEPLKESAIHATIKSISEADVLIVGGTSLSVYPAASFLNYFKGSHLLVINKTPLNISQNNVLAIDGNIGEVFKEIHSLYN
ncbi:NAD-dependent protein deacylase [Fundicoccus culcitae]|uniref:protein acetyllysine N-acetyltransferase n=1 Tax=Fundicoccus culcitae TaxID=2969821 RepID=A0ABY5P6B7_9LACT|nr:NAD-dependent protein deacylase [Fundicoccus culcitae]UUX34025.1 NAD-dependent protein deacylase [Fundicoccus culcitae]